MLSLRGRSPSMLRRAMPTGIHRHMTSRPRRSKAAALFLAHMALPPIAIESSNAYFPPESPASRISSARGAVAMLSWHTQAYHRSAIWLDAMLRGIRHDCCDARHHRGAGARRYRALIADALVSRRQRKQMPAKPQRRIAMRRAHAAAKRSASERMARKSRSAFAKRFFPPPLCLQQASSARIVIVLHAR